MRNKEFFLQFGLLLLFTATLIFFQQQIAVLAIHTPFSWMVWGLFSFLILNMYLLGGWAKQSPDKKLFDKLLFFFHALKIFAAILLFFYYHSNYGSGQKWHALPFIVLYLLFSTFEVHMLTKMVKR